MSQVDTCTITFDIFYTEMIGFLVTCIILYLK